MFKWALNLFDFSNRSKEVDHQIRIGSRVKTKEGEGTVVGGTLHIKFDKTKKLKGDRHDNNRTRSFNLENLKLLK